MGSLYSRPLTQDEKMLMIEQAERLSPSDQKWLVQHLNEDEAILLQKRLVELYSSDEPQKQASLDYLNAINEGRITEGMAPYFKTQILTQLRHTVGLA